MQDPRMVDQAVNSARERRPQKAGQGGEGILWTPTVDVGIGSKGHPSGFPCTAMPS